VTQSNECRQFVVKLLEFYSLVNLETTLSSHSPEALLGYSAHGLLKVWTEGYSEYSPNSGHELVILLLCLWLELWWHNFTQNAYFMTFFVSSISYRPTDLPLLKEFSKNISLKKLYIFYQICLNSGHELAVLLL
jgi:hypothetical protein